MPRLVFMRLFLYCFVLSFAISGHSQDIKSEILGKWIITEINNDNNIVTHCGSTKSETEARLNRDYVGASIEFLSNQKLIYRDKNNRLENEKDCKPFIGLKGYNWRITDEKKIELIELSNNKISKRLKIQYDRKKIHLNFFGILFVLEKS